MSYTVIKNTTVENEIMCWKNFLENKMTMQDKYSFINKQLYKMILDQKSSSIIQFLIDNGANVSDNKNDEYLRTPLHFATTTNLEIVMLLVQRGAVIYATDVMGRTPLFHALMVPNNIRIAQFLIQQGADINTRDNQGLTPLHEASDFGLYNFEIMQLLIELGADINAKDNFGMTPLHRASGYTSEWEISRFLRNQGFHPNNYRDFEHFHFIRANCNIESVKLLINKGASINEEDLAGATSFLKACETANNFSVVKILLQNGAELKAKDKKGFGALHYASRAVGNDETIKLLIENGANVNELSYNKETPLYEAIKWGIQVNIELLLQNGAHVHFAPSVINKLHELSQDIYMGYRIEEGMKIIYQHLIKLRMLNLENDEIFEKWRFTSNSEEWRNFIKACRVEAEKLLVMICLDRNVTFLDLLTKSSDKVAVFLNIEEIKEKLSLVDFDNIFPIYSGILKLRIKECTILARSLAQGYESLEVILDKFRIPGVDDIFCYFK